MTAVTKLPSAVHRLRVRRPARAPIGSFVGRERDVERVLAALALVSPAGGSRLVTVLGPPGVGKTRLAEECLDRAADVFGDHGGAWFCDLTDVGDGAALVHGVASVLGLVGREGATPSGAHELEDFVAAAGPMLLVLDNFEQLVGAADVVQRWCQAAPELCVLVTSRERLGVDGESVVELEPLGCPPPDAGGDEILASDAVRLLVARARAAGADLGGDRQVLARLVRQLDGIPLAIELAAARLRVLAPEDLLARLAQRQDVLARRPIHPRDRHATLTAAIEWSWQLLTAREQRALAECSIFARDFSVDAAEALLGSDALDLLAALRDKSLVHATTDGRLALYASIAEFATARLAGSGAAEEARLRHADVFAGRARELIASRSFQGGPDAALRVRFARDRANVLAALTFVRERAASPRLLAELALGLTLVQGAPVEVCLDAVGAALRALEASTDAEDAVLVARLLLARHGLLGHSGRYEESAADMSRLLAMPLAPGLRVLALLWHAVHLRYQGRTREALAVHLDLGQHLDDGAPPRLQAMQYACIGRLGHELRDEASARSNNERARVLAAEIGDAWMEALPLANVALLEQELGRFDRAQQLLDQALAALERVGEGVYVAVYSVAYGNLLLERGRPDEARPWYRRAEQDFVAGYGGRDAVELHCALAALEALHGAVEDAELHLERARRGLPRSGSALLDVLVESSALQLQLRRARDRGEPSPEIRGRHAALLAGDVAATSFAARFMLRLLGRALDAGEAVASSTPVAIAVARDGAWFRRAGKHVDLVRRGSLRRILAALVAAGGRAASRDALLAEGWPGERVLHDAASKRLRVAIATLRSLGLREAIVTAEDGYALDRNVIDVVEG